MGQPGPHSESLHSSASPGADGDQLAGRPNRSASRRPLPDEIVEALELVADLLHDFSRLVYQRVLLYTDNHKVAIRAARAAFLQAAEGMTANEIAAALGVDERTVKRDRKLLRSSRVIDVDPTTLRRIHLRPEDGIVGARRAR